MIDAALHRHRREEREPRIEVAHEAAAIERRGIVVAVATERLRIVERPIHRVVPFSASRRIAWRSESICRSRLASMRPDGVSTVHA